MTANLPPFDHDELLHGPKPIEVVHHGKQGSVTFLQAEAMAVAEVGDKSAAAIAKVLTDNGLGLR